MISFNVIIREYDFVSSIRTEIADYYISLINLYDLVRMYGPPVSRIIFPMPEALKVE